MKFLVTMEIDGEKTDEYKDKTDEEIIAILKKDAEELSKIEKGIRLISIVSEVDEKSSAQGIAKTNTQLPQGKILSDAWNCGTKDCVCNVKGKCDCHNYTAPAKTSPC
jgi:hypothetical protein